MNISEKRFGLPYNPKKEKRKKNRIIRNIILFLLVFTVLEILLSFKLASVLRNYIVGLKINDSIDSTWISSLGSYWGGIIGGIFSGIFAFLGVFYTIKYYKESDDLKEKASIQPFLLASVGTEIDPQIGFKVGKDDKKETRKINVTIKNIGNGFAKTLVIHTGFNVGGLEYRKVILRGEAEYLFLKIDPEKIKDGTIFEIQYVDSMRNEYVQEYTIEEKYGMIEIESGYPMFIAQS